MSDINEQTCEDWFDEEMTFLSIVSVIGSVIFSQRSRDISRTKRVRTMTADGLDENTNTPQEASNRVISISPVVSERVDNPGIGKRKMWHLTV